jgi:hypothetical protein
MSESKEPEGTPGAQGSPAQQETQTTPSPPTEGSAGAAGAVPAVADLMPGAAGAAPAAPGAAGAAPAAPGPAGTTPAMQQAVTDAMQPVVTAMQGAIRAEQDALAAVQPAVEAMAAQLIAGAARGTVQQAMQQTLQPVVTAMQGALDAEQAALNAMEPAVTMQEALAAMPQIVTALRGVVAAEQNALNVMRAAQPAVRDMQGSVAADGAGRDLTPGGAPNGMLRDTDGVLRDPTSGTDGAFFNQLKGVPIDYLIATPLISAARANVALAGVMTEFINEIGYDKDGKTRLIKFQLTRPVQDMASATPKFDKYQVDIEAPLLAVVPLPALLIDTVTVDLTVEIQQKTQQKTTKDANAKLEVGARYGFLNANFTGGYSLKQEDTRDTNQTAKYEVRVNARQQPLPEGMSKLMDVFASTITPMELPATAR